VTQGRETKGQPFLTADEELALLKIAHFAEDEKERIAARNELVMRNYPMIFGVTKKTFRFGFSVEECISVAVEAFIYSIQQFDFRQGRLSTYAVRAIQHNVVRWAGEQCGAVRVPATLQCKKTLARMSDDVKKAFANARQQHLSTDYTVSDGAGDDFPSIGQQLAYRDVDGRIADGPTLEEFNAAVNKLTGRSWVIISLRLEGRTLGEIGFVLGVTRERVRQLEAKARDQLRRLLQRHYPTGAR